MKRRLTSSGGVIRFVESGDSQPQRRIGGRLSAPAAALGSGREIRGAGASRSGGSRRVSPASRAAARLQRAGPHHSQEGYLRREAIHPLTAARDEKGHQQVLDFARERSLHLWPIASLNATLECLANFLFFSGVHVSEF